MRGPAPLSKRNYNAHNSSKRVSDVYSPDFAATSSGACSACIPLCTLCSPAFFFRFGDAQHQRKGDVSRVKTNNCAVREGWATPLSPLCLLLGTRNSLYFWPIVTSFRVDPSKKLQGVGGSICGQVRVRSIFFSHQHVFRPGAQGSPEKPRPSRWLAIFRARRSRAGAEPTPAEPRDHVYSFSAAVCGARRVPVACGEYHPLPCTEPSVLNWAGIN